MHLCVCICRHYHVNMAAVMRVDLKKTKNKHISPPPVVFYCFENLSKSIGRCLRNPANRQTNQKSKAQTSAGRHIKAIMVVINKAISRHATTVTFISSVYTKLPLPARHLHSAPLCLVMFAVTVIKNWCRRMFTYHNSRRDSWHCGQLICCHVCQSASLASL